MIFQKAKAAETLHAANAEINELLKPTKCCSSGLKHNLFFPHNAPVPLYNPSVCQCSRVTVNANARLTRAETFWHHWNPVVYKRPDAAGEYGKYGNLLKSIWNFLFITHTNMTRQWISVFCLCAEISCFMSKNTSSKCRRNVNEVILIICHWHVYERDVLCKFYVVSFNNKASFVHKRPFLTIILYILQL